MTTVRPGQAPRTLEALRSLPQSSQCSAPSMKLRRLQEVHRWLDRFNGSRSTACRTGGTPSDFDCPWVVRYTIDGAHRSKSFRTKAEAERYRGALLQAVQAGDRFDPATGEPESWQLPLAELRVHEWVRRWFVEQWPEWQPRTRASAAEALARFVTLAVDPRTAVPEALRSYLRTSLAPGNEGVRDVDLEGWLDRHSLTLGDLDKATVGEVARNLTRKLDGEPLRRDDGHAVPHQCPGVSPSGSRSGGHPGRSLAVRSTNSLAPQGRSTKTRRRHPVASETGDDGARPGRDRLSPTGQQGVPRDDGRGLLRRTATFGGRDAACAIARPADFGLGPHRRHRGGHLLRRAGRAEDGSAQSCRSRPSWCRSCAAGSRTARRQTPKRLIFRTRNGTRPTASNWGRAWHRALRSIGHSTLRVYDCRHAAATTWLSAGVPLGEVARRLGHSVETLVSTYVGALDGDERIANDRIDAALAVAAGQGAD